MSVLSNDQLMMTDDGYNIQRSLRFRSSASAYLSRTPSATSNRKTWTWSAWVKRGALSQAGTIWGSNFSAGGFGMAFGNYGGAGVNPEIIGVTLYAVGTVTTAAVFRDPSAWYHIVAKFDSTQATQANRFALYVNGIQQTLSGTLNVTLNADYNVNLSGALHVIGGESTYYNDLYMAEVNFIDGQALTPSSFGQTDTITGVWVPKKYSGTYGTNGFYLDFLNNTSATTLAYDKSGNGNNWTPNNISTTAGSTYDSMTDVPTLTSATAANYAVWNPLKTSNVGSPSTTTQNGNLTTTSPTSYGTFATMAVTSGKWYWEYTITTGTSWTLVGVIDSNTKLEIDKGTSGSNNVGYYANGQKAINGSFTSYGSSFTTNDIIGVALDCDANTVQFYKNNVAQGSISLPTAAGTSITAFACDANNAGSVINVNFGQRPLSYTPPTGFKALNTFNLPDPVIKKPNQYMDATTYTGTGAAKTIMNAGGFSPDLVWCKDRSSGAWSHALFDTVRGGTKRLSSNLTEAENNGQFGYISSFNSNGFSISAGATDIAEVGANNENYVGWQWKKGATPGFDIVTFTSPASGNFTVNHSLGVTPAMVIVKTRDTAGWNWHVWHKSLASATNSVLVLNSTAAVNSSFNMWGAAGATSTTIGITTGNPVPANSACVAYLFAEIPGFSKFGSYTGNGSADGPFVYCGFRPKYVMWKRTDRSGDDWWTYDAARDTYNVASKGLRPNLSAVEYSAATIDLLSNGFKLKSTAGDQNGSGGTYIYAAFAENPFKYSLAR